MTDRQMTERSNGMVVGLRSVLAKAVYCKLA